MRFAFYICDVFTDIRFGGNPLAVLPHAEGLSGEQMQQIAREFGFSESTFVFPPEQGGTRKVRIFTPTTEVPFAGHPNIGTAFVLAAAGELGSMDSSIDVTFEEKAGRVPVSIERRAGGLVWCELAAPELPSFGRRVSAELVAAAASLEPGDIVSKTHAPQVASVGLPFLVAELRDRAALERAQVASEGFHALVAEGVTPDVFLYVVGRGGRSPSDIFDIRARMFAPLDGVPEDPATGSANCALAGLLTHLTEAPSGEFSWRIAQGVEMGRPSVLEARSEKRDGRVVATWVGGTSVLVAEGAIEVD